METFYLTLLSFLAIKVTATGSCSDEAYPDFLQGSSETGDLEWN
jgi:hypothetical protein